MKIVSLVWFKVLPAHYGGQQGIVGFETALSKYFPLTCLCSSNNSTEASFKVRPVLPVSKTQFFNPVAIFKILRQVRKERANVLILEHPYHAVAGILAKRFYSLCLVVQEHNLEYLRFKSLGKWWWPILKIVERRVCRSADVVLFKTDEEKEKAKQMFGLKNQMLLTVPYCVEEKLMRNNKTEILVRHGIPAHHKLLLFAGTLDYYPNAAAVESIFTQLASLLNEQSYTFIICGRNQNAQFNYLNRLHHPQVILAGEVDQIGEYFQAADVFINPVLTGGGIQTKVLEALAFHCPVVSFQKGVAGINLNGTEKIFQVPNGDWVLFASTINKAAATEKTPTETRFLYHYSWEKVLQPLVAFFKTLELNTTVNEAVSQTNEQAA